MVYIKVNVYILYAYSAYSGIMNIKIIKLNNLYTKTNKILIYCCSCTKNYLLRLINFV